MSDLDGYIPVDERLRQFHEKYPEGVITTSVHEVQGGRFVVRAYGKRWPGDGERSALGSSVVPGETVYTYGSEYENAETSAIGRLLTIGFGFLKAGEKIATAQEVKQNSDAITEKAADHLVEVAKGKDAAAVRLALVAAGVNAPAKTDVEDLIRSLTPFQAQQFGKLVAA